MISTVLFDLDGTLTDPKVGITRATSLALAHFGIRAEPESLTDFIGPPLHDKFREVYGFTDEMCEEAVRVFRAYYVERGWRENVPYPGMRELLSSLKAAGKTLLVATTKPEVTAVRILEHFEMAESFALICGAPPGDPEAARKVRVIENALARAGISDRDSAVMVGDRRYDIEGAHLARLRAVGVLYGYGSREELIELGFSPCGSCKP